MLKKSGLLLAVCAGAACSVAVADFDDTCTLPSKAAPLPSAGGFGTRPDQVVYGNSFPGNGGDFRGLGTAGRKFADDVTMSLGVGNLPPVTLDGSFFALVQTAAGTVNDVSAKVSIYDNFTGWTIGTFPGTVLLGSATYDLLDFLDPGYITYYPAPVAFPAAATIIVPDLTALVTLDVLTYQAATTHVTAYSVGRGTTAAVVNPGTSDGDRWADNNNDGLITGPAPSAELFNTVAPNFRALYLGLQALINNCAPIPAGATAVGSLPNGVTTRSGTTVGGAKWFTFTTTGDATDAVRQFLNVDTEGSAADVAIGMYNTSIASCGALVGFIGTGSDDDSGSGTQAQLTFGAGRIAGTGDGRDCDGRDGEVVAGSYVVGVAPAGSSFGPGYAVSIPGGAPTGAFTINWNTNTPGAALATPSDTPDTAGAPEAQNVGCMVGQPLVVGTTYNVDPYEVAWYRFSVPAIAAADPVQYMDIDCSRTVLPADGVAYVFDCAGNVVATSDDGVAGTYFQPAFSWGNVGPRNQGTAPAGLYAGQNGALAAGEYFMAMGLFPVTALAANDRFHARSSEGSSLDLNPDFYSSVSGTCGTCGGGGGCDGIDFNNDGVSPDSLDIDDFLSVFGGGPCSNDPLCGDIDFNNDGVSPDSLDIDSLLSVFGGGPCL